MRVFELADRHRGSYSDDALGSVVCPFYCSYSGYQDELLWAAAWLHRASSNASFMPYVRANGMQLGAGDDDFSFSWDDKRIGTKVLLAKGFLCRRLPGLQLYKAHSDSYICTLVLGTSSFQASQYTPGGLIWLRGPLACQRRQIQRPHGPPHSPGTSGAAPPSSVPSSMAAHGWEEQAESALSP